MSSESHTRLEGLEERMAERGESPGDRRLRQVKVLMVKLRKIGTKQLEQNNGCSSWHCQHCQHWRERRQPQTGHRLKVSMVKSSLKCRVNLEQP
jgi:hypothetical protein